MLKKMTGKKVELKPKIPSENEKLCDVCGGIGWLLDEENGCIDRCNNCYNGIIKLCDICHQPTNGYCMSNKCREIRDSQAEQKQLDKAIISEYKDVPDEYKNMMFSETYPYNNGYFEDIDELVEYCEEADITIPKYVWSTDKTTLSIDADAILEDACNDLHEDALDNIDEINELQKFLDNWCAKQTGADTYFVNYKYAIKVIVD